jgi:Mg2+ and Co2+ transporter CorA
VKDIHTDIDGIHDVELIQKIGTHFNIHPLILEDIVNTWQRERYRFPGVRLHQIKFQRNRNSRLRRQIIPQTPPVKPCGMYMRCTAETATALS